MQHHHVMFRCKGILKSRTAWSPLAHQLSPWSTRRSDQSRPLQPAAKPCCLALLFGPCILNLFFYLSLHSCCPWQVCKLSAWNLRQSFLRRRIRNFASCFLVSLTRLTSNSYASKLSSWGNDPFSSAKTYAPERPRTQHVWVLWMLKSATRALIVTFLVATVRVNSPNFT